MKTISVDKQECIYFLERNEKGAVLNFLVPQDDGTYLNVRHAFQPADEAIVLYDRFDDAEARKYMVRADAGNKKVDFPI